MKNFVGCVVCLATGNMSAPLGCRLFKSDVLCQNCGDGGHPTIDCPMKGATWKKMDDEYKNFLAELGGTMSESVTKESTPLAILGSNNSGSTPLGPTTADAMEECRKLCGGHGYLCSSGLPELFAVYVPTCTYEGDNIVLLLQVARFLVKTVSHLGSGKKPAGTVAYMGRAEYLMKCWSNVEKAGDWLKPSSILEAFETRAFRMAVACSQNLSQFSNPEEGFAELSADLAEASLAHCQLIVVSKYIDKLKEQIPGKGIKQILEVLCQVYALHILHKHQGEFLATGSITAKQAALAFTQLRHLYSKVRPNAVALVDSFNHTDHYLGSILGRYDGNVYPKLYDAAWQDPLNDSDVTDGYTEYIRPLIKNQLHLARL